MNDTSRQIVISQTGKIHGRGSDYYKWVSHLTADERQLVREGGVVLVPDPLYGKRAHTTAYKQVVYMGRGRYRHKNFYFDAMEDENEN